MNIAFSACASNYGLLYTANLAGNLMETLAPFVMSNQQLSVVEIAGFSANDRYLRFALSSSTESLKYYLETRFLLFPEGATEAPGTTWNEVVIGFVYLLLGIEPNEYDLDGAPWAWLFPRTARGQDARLLQLKNELRQQRMRELQDERMRQMRRRITELAIGAVGKMDWKASAQPIFTPSSLPWNASAEAESESPRQETVETGMCPYTLRPRKIDL